MTRFLPHNMAGIDYPVSLASYPLFEKQNDISINVLYASGKVDDIYPLYKTKAEKPNHVNLLVLLKRDSKDINKTTVISWRKLRCLLQIKHTQSFHT